MPNKPPVAAPQSHPAAAPPIHADKPPPAASLPASNPSASIKFHTQTHRRAPHAHREVQYCSAHQAPLRNQPTSPSHNSSDSAVSAPPADNQTSQSHPSQKTPDTPPRPFHTPALSL